MFQLIKNYVSKMTIEDLNSFALSKDITLNESELDFVYRFIKKNYEALYANPNLDLSRYKKFLSSENYDKIMNLIREYKTKYASLLN